MRLSLTSPVILLACFVAVLGFALVAAVQGGAGGPLMLALGCLGALGLLMVHRFSGLLKESRRIQEEAEQFAHLATRLSGAVYAFLDADGTARFVGPEEHPLARRLGEGTGRFLQDQVHPEDLPAFQTFEAREDQEAGCTYRISDGEGGWRAVIDRRVPFPGAHGEEGRFALLVEGATLAGAEATRVLEDRLGQAREAAHDLNDCLMFLRAHLALAQGRPGALPALGDGVTRAAEQGRRLFELLVPRPAVAQADPGAEAAETDGQGRTVLLVDDESHLRRVLAMGLELAGYRVIEAGDGVEGFAAFVRHRAELDVALVDLAMPRMGGDQLYLEIRKVDPGLPVILMSGYHYQDVLEGLKEPPSGGFLPKPSTLPEVLAAVGRACSVR